MDAGGQRPGVGKQGLMLLGGQCGDSDLKLPGRRVVKCSDGSDWLVKSHICLDQVKWSSPEAGGWTP